MPLYRFTCKLGHVSEHLLPLGSADVTSCDVCGHAAHRQAVNRVAIGTPSVDSRNMFRRYSESVQEMDYAASRVERDTGQAIQAPPFWQQAKRRAAAIEAAGEADDFKPRT